MDIDVDINSIPAGDLKKYTLVDIREANELAYAPSDIECPHVPLSGFPEGLDFFKKDGEYLIFCAMGGRSHGLADYLTQQGYKAYSVNGGVGALNAYLRNNAS